jgi:ABC-type transport system involved in multi-copper enzyme maturation permease subunit
MRAYYAVIKDSFREALSSRVLWILLVLATLLLAAIVPLSITDQLPSSLGAGDITYVAGLAIKLHKAGSADADTPGKRIWTRLDAGLRKKLTDVATSQEPNRAAADLLEPSLRGALNAMLSQRDLYDEAVWAGAKPSAEANALAARGVDKLSEDELRRFNRLLLEAAFPLEIAQAKPAEISLAYFGASFGGPIPLAKDFVVKATLSTFMNFVVGTLGVFAAILVTASIIPQTFEAGAIDLLLSKPISRFWLYVTKFVGGCAFTFINAAYVIGGLWLIVGLRYGIWSGRLLWCIPLFMFLFAIYYSVSALAGVVWKNAIVCVVITIVFWIACFTVGVSKNVVETVFLNARRLVRIEQAGDALVAADERGQLLLWQASTDSWQPIATQDAKGDAEPPPVPFGMPFRTVGPVYDARSKRLLVARPPGGRGGFMSQNGVLFAGRRDDNWRLSQIVAVPTGTTGLFVAPKGHVIAVGASGVFRLEGEKAKAAKEAAAIDAPAAAPSAAAGPEKTSPTEGATQKFVEVGPASGFGGQVAAAMDPTSGALAVFNRGRLRILKPDDQGHYVQAARVDIEGPQAAVLGFGGSSVIVALADGTIKWFDAQNLALREEFGFSSPRAPRFALVSPDGRWLAVLFHDGRLWLYDAEHDREASRSIDGQGDISAVALGPEDELLVVDRLTRMTRYRLDPLARVERVQPDLDLLERVYRYAIKPIYTVFPKPGELGNMVSYLLTDQDTQSPLGREDDLASARLKIDVWGPIWSNLVFVVIFVCLGGLYTKYKDF